ncbi:ssDNA-binding domain-containing protein [Eubacteriales bacterium OttesenSCG-928-M02]|nr:ssDNA-binding domain-containing protein [Eubacteriales bacterium OttesenSCG-928-M02]
MNNYDDIFDDLAQPEQSYQPDAPFDKEVWATKKQGERASAYELIDRTAESVAQDSDMFKTYLDVQSRFERYSVGNVLLIASQKPDAKRIGDFDYWKDQGGYVKKNEKGIVILEPGDEYTRDDGSIGVSYNPKKVFDISQTTMRSKMQPQVNRDERALIKALVHNASVSIISADELDGVKGAVFDPKKQAILVRKGMEGEDIFRSFATLLAHAAYANGNPDYRPEQNEFRAYCVSYILCERNSIDTQGYDFSRLPESFVGMDAQEVRGELAAIRDTANDISSRMIKALEQRKPVRQQEQER